MVAPGLAAKKHKKRKPEAPTASSVCSVSFVLCLLRLFAARKGGILVFPQTAPLWHAGVQEACRPLSPGHRGRGCYAPRAVWFAYKAI
jgi:hypothetical protein